MPAKGDVTDIYSGHDGEAGIEDHSNDRRADAKKEPADISGM